MDSPPCAEQPRTVASSERSVCVVDDDIRTAHVLAMLLRMDGYAAESCSSTRIVEQLRRGPTPAVLVMTVSMSRADTVRGLLQVRSHHPALPLVIITEHPQWAQRLGPLQGPQPIVFTKPVDYAALLLTLRTILAPWS